MTGSELNAQEIKDMVEAALVECRKHIDDFNHEPINWGDLHCVEVKPVLWSVLIEEAAPGCADLCEAVQVFLAVHGVNAVVKTEW